MGWHGVGVCGGGYWVIGGFRCDFIGWLVGR